MFQPLDALSQKPSPVPLRAPSLSPRSARLIPERSSRGLSASLLLLIAGCCRETLARTALSRIKQVVRLSHNFIVHCSPTAEHGASRNQQVSPGKRGEQHRGRAARTSSCSPSEPKRRKIQVPLPDNSLNHSSKCP